MAKKKHGGKDKRVHCPTWGTGRPLCGAKSGKVSSDPTLINCDTCGRVAVRLAEDIDARGLQRQEAALAQNQPSRWWVADQVTTDGPVLKAE